MIVHNFVKYLVQTRINNPARFLNVLVLLTLVQTRLVYEI
jgi:hypothetical protein